ncbi:FecCD family ABC transporter permease [Peribacillus butanolivorans]|uniref:FecCD family ABC transporter permease n=1 Tax=Peribacillus butanolivorans TaxID=421767 RepID=UPI0035E1098B
MKWKDRISWKVFIIILIILSAIFSIIMGLTLGSVDISFREIVSILIGNELSSNSTLIWEIRLPRVLVSALAGLNLAVSGALLQGIMRNPIADPHIIGVSSGAALFGMVILLVFPEHSQFLVPSAFLGAMLTTLFVYLLAWNKGITPIRIILAGVAVSAFLSSAVSGLFTFYSDRVPGVLGFMVGSLSGVTWTSVYTILPYSIIGIILSLLGSQRMNIILLGDSEARSLGLNTEGYRIWFIAISAVLAASAVSVVGLLGFVGLIVPHAARILVGNDYRILLPCTLFLGITTLTLSDTLARVSFAPIELPVGIIMGVIGAPFFLFLLRRKSQL